MSEEKFRYKATVTLTQLFDIVLEKYHKKKRRKLIVDTFDKIKAILRYMARVGLPLRLYRIQDEVKYTRAFISYKDPEHTVIRLLKLLIELEIVEKVIYRGKYCYRLLYKVTPFQSDPGLNDGLQSFYAPVVIQSIREILAGIRTSIHKLKPIVIEKDLGIVREVIQNTDTLDENLRMLMKSLGRRANNRFLGDKI